MLLNRARGGISRWLVTNLAFPLVLLLAGTQCGAADRNATQAALDRALSGTSAVAVVLDAADGLLLAVAHSSEAAQRSSTPGSTLKPLFLQAALEKQIILPDTALLCHRHLRIHGRDLSCTHPAALSTFRAEDALAYSCNSYFAQLSERFTPNEMMAVLEAYGVGSRPHLFSAESAGMIHEASGGGERVLQMLGLDHVTISPAQLAKAYWQLGRHIDAVPPVRRGLEASVQYGMANPARTEGVSLLGKTGTASDAGQNWTHGWLAGIASCGPKTVVVVILIPRGNGADAALLAHSFLSAWRDALVP